MRSLARDLQIDPSVLSKLLRGERGWSESQRLLLRAFLVRMHLDPDSLLSEIRNLELAGLRTAEGIGESAALNKCALPPPTHSGKPSLLTN